MSTSAMPRSPRWFCGYCGLAGYKVTGRLTSFLAVGKRLIDWPSFLVPRGNQPAVTTGKLPTTEYHWVLTLVSPPR